MKDRHLLLEMAVHSDVWICIFSTVSQHISDRMTDEGRKLRAARLPPRLHFFSPDSSQLFATSNGFLVVSILHL